MISSFREVSYFHETSHMLSFAKIKPSRKFTNLQYVTWTLVARKPVFRVSKYDLNQPAQLQRPARILKKMHLAILTSILSILMRITKVRCTDRLVCAFVLSIQPKQAFFLATGPITINYIFNSIVSDKFNHTDQT